MRIINTCTRRVTSANWGINTNIILPTDYGPRPNEYNKKLKENVPYMNSRGKIISTPSNMDNVPPIKTYVEKIK